MEHSEHTEDWAAEVRVYNARQVAQEAPIPTALRTEFKLLSAIWDYTRQHALTQLASATRATAPEIAAAIGVDVGAKMAAFGDVVLQVAAALKKDGPIIRSIAELVVESRQHPEMMMPNLDHDALAYVRAVAHLFRHLNQNKVPAPPSDNPGVAATWQRFAAMHQALMLLGNEDHKVSADVQEAIARALWDTLHSLVPPGNQELVADAFSAGQADQAKEEMKSVPARPWAVVKAEILGGEGA